MPVGWKPIKTCSKDPDELYVVGWWTVDLEWHWEPGYWDKSGYWYIALQCDHEGERMPVQPTHWHPVPPAPRAKPCA